jgi:hypothetical protein
MMTRRDAIHPHGKLLNCVATPLSGRTWVQYCRGYLPCILEVSIYLDCEVSSKVRRIIQPLHHGKPPTNTFVLRRTGSDECYRILLATPSSIVHVPSTIPDLSSFGLGGGGDLRHNHHTRTAGPTAAATSSSDDAVELAAAAAAFFRSLSEKGAATGTFLP